jgi:mono/diheme cytochrome c family protein
MDVYAEKHKPDMENPTAITAANLTAGAKEYEQHCAFCHGGAQAKIDHRRAP